MTDDFSFDFSADLPQIETYNARKSEKSKYRIRTEIVPAPYEGRIGAPLTWLLANPGYDAVPGYAFNRPPPIVEGWPLQSLAPGIGMAMGSGPGTDFANCEHCWVTSM